MSSFCLCLSSKEEYDQTVVQTMSEKGIPLPTARGTPTSVARPAPPVGPAALPAIAEAGRAAAGALYFAWGGEGARCPNVEVLLPPGAGPSPLLQMMNPAAMPNLEAPSDPAPLQAVDSLIDAFAVAAPGGVVLSPVLAESPPDSPPPPVPRGSIHVHLSAQGPGPGPAAQPAPPAAPSAPTRRLSPRWTPPVPGCHRPSKPVSSRKAPNSEPLVSDRPLVIIVSPPEPPAPPSAASAVRAPVPKSPRNSQDTLVSPPPLDRGRAFGIQRSQSEPNLCNRSIAS